MNLKIEDINLFKNLQELEVKEFGKNNHPISNNIQNELIKVTSDLLSRIPDNMPEYTNHDIQHSLQILKIVDNILPKEVNLNIIEIQILIYSIILHDIGMVINLEEKKLLLESKEFLELTREYEKNTQDDEILTELIRKTHVERSSIYIDKFINEFKKYKIDFSYKDIDISNYIKNVIESHAHNINYIKDEKKYPLSLAIEHKYINIQYLAVLLRLGDILDFDMFRTPYYLFHHIGIKNFISQEEWLKHQSIKGSILTPEKIEFHAEPNTIQIHRKIEEFIDWIELERNDSMDLLSQTKSEKYFLNLKENVKLNIVENGYLYNNLEINLDYENVLNILMGTELYDNVDIFLRELIQNAYDACKYYQELFNREEHDFETYEPRVIIKYDADEKILEILDNGIGIDINTFENYVIKIGKSFYKSNYFDKEGLAFSPISNFGIGIISCFMISDTIEIESYKEGYKSIHYVMNIKDKYIEQLETTKKIHGTKIKLKLHDDFFEKIESKSIVEIIENNMTSFPIPIELRERGQEKKIFNNKMIIVPKEYKLINGIDIIEFDDTDQIEGYIVLITAGLHQYIKNTKVSQQSFVVTGRGNNINLNPAFLSGTKYFINIPDSHKLHLKASRNGVQNDDKLKYIQEAVSNKIITYITNKKLNKESIFKYLNEGRGNAINFQCELNFLANLKVFDLLEKVTLPKIAYNQKLVSFHDISNKLNHDSKEYKIAVIKKNYFENKQNIQSLLSYFFNNNYDYILIDEFHNVHYFYQLIKPFLEYNKMIVPQSVQGLTYNSILINNKIDLVIDNYRQQYNWISVRDNIDENYFTIVSSNQYNGNLILINKNNHLSKLLIKNDDKFYIKGFINSVINSFEKFLLFNQPLNEFIWDEKENHFSGDNLFAFPIKFQKSLTKSYLASMNKCLEHQVLNQLIADTIINKKDKSKYLLTKKDFPQWYFKDE